MNEEYVVLGNEEGNDDQIDYINQGIKTSSLANSIPKVMKEELMVINNEERNENQTDIKNQGIRTSTRPRKFPNTRSDDFLWVQNLIWLRVEMLLI
jgi:ethanolamine ammonia-lyase large subunit